MKNIILKSILATLLATLIFIVSAYAQVPKEDSAVQFNLTLLSQVKIGIQQAQRIALTKSPGEVIGIYIDSLRDDAYVPVYKVYILKGSPQVISVVTIDAKTGKILMATDLPSGVFPLFQFMKGRKPVKPDVTIPK